SWRAGSVATGCSAPDACAEAASADSSRSTGAWSPHSAVSCSEVLPANSTTTRTGPSSCTSTWWPSLGRALASDAEPPVHVTATAPPAGAKGAVLGTAPRSRFGATGGLGRDVAPRAAIGDGTATSGREDVSTAAGGSAVDTTDAPFTAVSPTGGSGCPCSS